MKKIISIGVDSPSRYTETIHDLFGPLSREKSHRTLPRLIKKQRKKKERSKTA